MAGLDGLDWRGQQDFSGGAWPLQERVPRNGVEDCVNGLYGDDGSIFKRGGGAYKSSAFTDTLTNVWAANLAGGDRVVARGTTSQLVVLGADETTLAELVITDMQRGRPCVIGGILAIPGSASTPAAVLYGGSRKTANYLTGTMDVTNGSTAVVGHGTAWSANIDAGMILYRNGVALGMAAVAAVGSNTALTLATPWPGPTAAGVAYEADYVAAALPPGLRAGVPHVAAVANRLAVGANEVIAFSPIGDPQNFNATDYHLLPGGALLSGLQDYGTDLLVFTTAGIFRIGNMAYDLTDALGNVQQTLSNEGRDVILWNENGIVGIDGAVLVPALDDIYTYSSAGVQRLNAPGLRKLWRQYVKAGYTLGNAAVHRGHYFLPILNGSTFVDAVVLKLDTGAWSRWDGHSAGVSFAQRGATSSAPPKLLAAKSTRILDLTGTFEPAAGNKLEADGTTHNLTVTFRTERRRDGVPQVLRKTRVRYELDDAASDNPTIAVAVAVGRPGSAFTTLTGSGPENVGQTPKTWRVGRRGTEARVRLTSSGPSSSLVIRSVEQAWYLSGRQ